MQRGIGGHMPLRDQSEASTAWVRTVHHHTQDTGDEPGQPRRRASLRRTVEETNDEDDDSLYDLRLPSSTRRYHTTIEKALPRTVVIVTQQQGPPPIRRASLLSEASTRTQEHSLAPQPIHQMHWLFYTGFAIAALIVL